MDAFEVAGVVILLGVVLTIAFIALLVVIIIQLFRSGGRTRRPPALLLLEERYARGEIDRQEFLERRTLLLPGGPGP